MLILGISAFYHDSAAAVVSDGAVVAAAQEERFTRRKHDSSFPENAIKACLATFGATGRDVDRVVFYEKPYRKFARLVATYAAFAPRGFAAFHEAMSVWMTDKLFQRQRLLQELASVDRDLAIDGKLRFGEHHFSHAASAFYPSPFTEAAVLTIDGVGEWATTSSGVGRGRDLQIAKEIHFPHSLGMLYSAFTSYTGFKVNSGEYKVMGLAPYGDPKYVQLILNNLIDLKPDGSFRLNLDYFDFCTGFSMINENFCRLFGKRARHQDELLTQTHMDFAASIQVATEEIILRVTRALAAETGLPNLCLAGGVALNCVANGKILRDGAFREVWIQPAAGDAGGAIGAAFAAYHFEEGMPRALETGRDGMKGSFLGPDFTQSDIEKRLSAIGARYVTLHNEALIDAAAQALAEGKAIGWFSGRMEFGPRALGARSILADPRSPAMQKTLNLKVKYRESFRPFAPAVLAEDLSDWFDLDRDSPYMLLVAPVRKSRQRPMTTDEATLFGIDKLNVPRSDIPAVTHVDYSARIQTVHKETNLRFYKLIARFKEMTGCPLLVNTSFNVRGEPIVCTPEDAFRCFMGTDLDVLTVGNCLLTKKDQDAALAKSYEDAFEPD